MWCLSGGKECRGSKVISPSTKKVKSASWSRKLPAQEVWWLKLNFKYSLMELYVRFVLTYKFQFQQRNASSLSRVSFRPAAEKLLSKRKSNLISLMRCLPTAREVRKWQHALTQIWKRKWEGASRVTAPIRITGWHTWERFWSGGCGQQLHRAPVTQALHGIGQQDARACSNNTCWSGGGLDPGSHRGAWGQIQILPSVESQSAADSIMKAH